MPFSSFLSLDSGEAPLSVAEFKGFTWIHPMGGVSQPGISSASLTN